jgi:hypothetical protein
MMKVIAEAESGCMEITNDGLVLNQSASSALRYPTSNKLNRLNRIGNMERNPKISAIRDQPL